MSHTHWCINLQPVITTTVTVYYHVFDYLLNCVLLCVSMERLSCKFTEMAIRLKHQGSLQFIGSFCCLGMLT